MTRSKKIVYLFAVVSFLAVANLIVHTNAAAASELNRIFLRPPETCAADSGRTPSAAELSAYLSGTGSGPIKDRSTYYNCGSCWYYMQAGQNWCQHLATVCPDPWPWHENYEQERRRYWYICTWGDTYYCTDWIDSGCCGTSEEEEPECAPNDQFCISGTLPPEN